MAFPARLSLQTPSPHSQRVPPLWLLVLITLAGTVAMHMFVPALPDAAHHLQASPGQAQLTITVYIIGLGLGQLIYGPLSDSLGRRPMLLVGLSLYTAAGIAAFFAPTIEALVVARLFQALGGCAGLALGRAIARDTSTAENAVGKLALLNLMMMIGPGLAPAIGSWIDALLGWRSIFAMLAIMGGVTLTGVCFLLNETGKPTGELHLSTIRADYRRLLGTPSFVLFALGGGCATTAIYAFVSAAPFIFIEQLHASKTDVGLYLGLIMVGVALGNVLTRSLIRRWSLDRVMLIGNTLSLVCAAALLLQVLSGHLSINGTLLSMAGVTMGAGLASPTALARALGIHPDLTGSAAGVYGFTQMLIGGICTLAAGLGSNPALSAAVVLLVASILAQIGFRQGMRRPLVRTEKLA
ncbi:multidrug effflux MFS transporter [Comamonas sp. J-3]|uniref:multidrug effflux MFS transporter n=1 Tax=Comamonas trifloxystrobinivorans TaxID=3350256 RepID=UPI00372AA7E5